MNRRAPSSLTGRLLIVLISSLTMLALLLGAGGALFINGVAEQTADRVLKASARAIAETIAVEGGEITLDLPASALGMLEDDARDSIYYNIRHDGQLLTGYPDFPVAPQFDTEHTYFRYETYREVRVRVASEARRLPRVPGLVVVQVAETLDERQALARRMLVGLAALEGALITFVGLLLLPATYWSLRPVIRIRRELEARSHARADFTPLETGAVPSELRGLVVGFNGLLNRLEQAVDGMRRFTADASHQMRTPLAILSAHLAVIREHGSQSPQGESSLRDLEAAVARLKHLLTQLIALARAEESAAGAVPTRPLELDAVAADVARKVAPSALERGVEIHFEQTGELFQVEGNPVLLEEVISNLLENAVRYNRPGGTATIRVASDPSGSRLEIEDDGPGIPERDREDVFRRFHRLSRDQQEPGSGLGLPIVKQLLQAMNAEISLATARSGKGLLVRVTFPRLA
jgi:two-component system sensor histidine kinase TctE